MLKKSLLFLITIYTFTTANLFAQSSGFGAGIMLGEPTGISLKNWTSQINAWDAGIAWGFGNHGAFHLHGDYLWHKYGLIRVDKGRLPLYYGVGARFLFADETRFGIRGVIGLDYQVSGVPLDIFLELVPIFDLAPRTEFSFNGALGFRYFF